MGSSFIYTRITPVTEVPLHAHMNILVHDAQPIIAHMIVSYIVGVNSSSSSSSNTNPYSTSMLYDWAEPLEYPNRRFQDADLYELRHVTDSSSITVTDVNEEEDLESYVVALQDQVTVNRGQDAGPTTTDVNANVNFDLEMDEDAAPDEYWFYDFVTRYCFVNGDDDDGGDDDADDNNKHTDC